MKRKGFGLILAIIIMVVASTLMTLMISLSTQGTKNTTDIYLKEQTELLAKSAAEYAILALSAHEINSTNGCLEQININYPNGTSPTHKAEVSIQYIGNGLPTTGNDCNSSILSNNISTTESNVTVILDIVAYVNPELNLTTEPIRYHRRTIQKP